MERRYALSDAQGAERLQAAQHFRCRFDRVLNVRQSMGRGNETGFELRRGEVNTFVQHSVKILCEPVTVTLHRISQRPHRSAGEIGAIHRTATVKRNRHAGRLCGILHPGFKLRAELLEPRVGVSRFRISDFGFRTCTFALTLTLSSGRRDSFRPSPGFRSSYIRFSARRRFSFSHRTGAGRSEGCSQFFQRRDARRHRQRIAAQRAGLIHRPERREPIHDVRAPAERAHRQTAADDFAETRQIRRDAESVPARRRARGGNRSSLRRKSATRRWPA